MSPPIHKDWWLAAALTSATLPGALAQTTASVDRPRSGVVTSTTVAPGGSRSVSSAPLFVDGAANQRLVTGPSQSMHVLFSDQSAITLGPNSEVVIAKYQFDNQAKDGQLVMEMTKGFLRVVGGLLSKKRDTLVITPTATVGIRGGITLVEQGDNRTRGTFLFGQSMRMSQRNGGDGEEVNRPGFGIDADQTGLSSPRRIPSNELSQQLAGLEGGTLPPELPPDEAENPQANRDVKNIAPDRLGDRKDPDLGISPPTLADILGSQGPGNQS